LLVCLLIRNLFSYGAEVMTMQDWFNNGIKVINRERRRNLAKYRQQVDRTE